MAATPRELAARIGVDEDAFCRTLETYNASCAEGKDWAFFKPSVDMAPLETGPYYAIGGKLDTDGAFGGVRVNANMQAYGTDGGLVDGLYVTGDFASGRHISLGGVKKQVLNDMSWALSSGFIAGTEAAKALKNGT